MPLDLQLLRGFRRDVVLHLPDIAYGRTASYAQMADLAGSPRAVRAVGTACALNPLPVVLPCHRVVRSDGSPGQYAGGAEAKLDAPGSRDACRGGGVASGSMCRNITTLRGLEPAATSEEIEAAARQYVRKVTGVQSLSDATREPFEDAVRQIAEITARLLDDLPARRQPPTTVPPLRRADVQARIAAREAHERAHELGLPHEHEDDDGTSTSPPASRGASAPGGGCPRARPRRARGTGPRRGAAGCARRATTSVRW